MAVAAFLLKKDNGINNSGILNASKSNSTWESLSGFRNV